MAQITRIGVSGFPRPVYGTFAAATPAAVQITRLGVSGFPRPVYAAFKAATPAAQVTTISPQMINQPGRLINP